MIEAAGLADYFLIVWDIVREARARGIRCQGRGSAANSLVAYLLGITPVDPLAHHLLFERFLSDRTDTMPDIDLDFDRDRRDEVIAYVYERYGREHTALVCNVVTYQPRLAVRDAARALGFPPEELGIGAWARSRGAERSMAEQGRSADGERTTQWDTRHAGTPPTCHLNLQPGSCSTDLVRPAHRRAAPPVRPRRRHAGHRAAAGRGRAAGARHQAGRRRGAVEQGLGRGCRPDQDRSAEPATLGMVTEACALIAQRHGVTPDLDALPLDDPAVYRLLAEGDTIGCFQVESRAQSSMLPRLKPQCFEDLIIEVAIVRPGPIQGGMVHPYLRRRQGLEPVTYLHPSLEPVLSETLGVVIFQEQVIRVAVALAGFTPGEADLLRRAMSRSRSAEAMAVLRDRFLAGAQANGVELAVAEEVFGQLQGFATYGFCKSHAASVRADRLPDPLAQGALPGGVLLCALNHQPMGFYSPEVVVGDAKRHGITVLRPDVNASEDGCTLEEGSGGETGQRSRGAGANRSWLPLRSPFKGRFFSMQAWTGQVKSPLASSTALVGQGSGSKRPCGKVSPRMAAARMQRRPRRKQLSKRGCERWVVRRRAMCVAGRSAKVLTGRLSSASPPTLRTPQRGDGDGEPQAGGPCRLDNLGLLPLPAAPFGIFEPTLDPGVEAVPADIGLLRSQIGEDQPRIGVGGGPGRQECAGEGPTLEADDAAGPSAADARHHRAQGPEGVLGCRPKEAAGIDAQVRVPTQADDLPVEPSRIQAAVGQHQHGPIVRHTAVELLKQGQPMGFPGAQGIAGQDDPGDRTAQPR